MWHALLTVTVIAIFAFFAGLWALTVVGLFNPLRPPQAPPAFRPSAISRAGFKPRRPKSWMDRLVDAILASLLLTLLLLAGFAALQWLIGGR